MTGEQTVADLARQIVQAVWFHIRVSPNDILNQHDEADANEAVVRLLRLDARADQWEQRQRVFDAAVAWRTNEDSDLDGPLWLNFRAAVDALTTPEVQP